MSSMYKSMMQQKAVAKPPPAPAAARPSRPRPGLQRRDAFQDYATSTPGQDLSPSGSDAAAAARSPAWSPPEHTPSGSASPNSGIMSPLSPKSAGSDSSVSSAGSGRKPSYYEYLESKQKAQPSLMDAASIVSWTR